MNFFLLFERSGESVEGPLLPPPPDELGPLLLVHLECVVGDVGLRDDPEHLHPVGEDLVSVQV